MRSDAQGGLRRGICQGRAGQTSDCSLGRAVRTSSNTVFPMPNVFCHSLGAKAWVLWLLLMQGTCFPVWFSQNGGWWRWGEGFCTGHSNIVAFSTWITIKRGNIVISARFPDSGCLSLNPGFATYRLCDWKQVTPSLTPITNLKNGANTCLYFLRVL